MRSRSGADGVVSAVDVDDLAGGGGEEIGEQRHARRRDGRRVLDVPTERGARRPRILELLETREAPSGNRADGSGGDEVHANAVGTEVASEIPRRRLQRGLGDAHPVVDGPCDAAVVEVEADDRTAG